MANFSTWLLTIFMVMFWLFRAVVALCSQFSIDLMGIEVYNFNFEVVMAFVTLICILLVSKRKLIGAVAYLMLYGAYFGEHFVSSLSIFANGQALSLNFIMNLFIDFVAIILALFAVFDMLVDKGRKANPSDGKTDWYFKNEKYDEELKARDQREDNNEYKFY